jgi:hypothetical protein
LLSPDELQRTCDLHHYQGAKKIPNTPGIDSRLRQ